MITLTVRDGEMTMMGRQRRRRRGSKRAGLHWAWTTRSGRRSQGAQMHHADTDSKEWGNNDDEVAAIMAEIFTGWREDATCLCLAVETGSARRESQRGQSATKECMMVTMVRGNLEGYTGTRSRQPKMLEDFKE